ncbi:MAG TPA: sulfate ABC transporter permease subunit [Chloroflexota bacterium]|nr:sulfate ABC transporter permease subunit [Chloroflexota bacterium]HUM68430.1 sulfate ABC transporter permease subunit [Chloroflexota bacterium]
MATITTVVRGTPSTRGSLWRRRVLIGIVALYVGLLILAPLIALVRGAFQEGLGAMWASINQPDVWKAFWQTIKIGLIVVVVHTVFGTAVAWAFVRDNFRGKWLLNAIVDLPFAVSPVVVGYMLILIFGRRGFLAPLMAAWDIQIVFAVPGMILATLFVTMPFMVRVLVPVLEAFDVRQEQAAATLGSGSWLTFRRITFPALRWGFVYGITLTLARALGEFGAVLVVGGGIQGRTETVPIFIYRSLDDRMYTAAYSTAFLLGLVSVLLILGTDWLRRREK